MSPTHGASSVNRLVSIQLLRAVAALGVVMSHVELYYSEPQLYPVLTKGAGGVDLFFVISGFIMVYTSERLYGRLDAPRTFLQRRIVRVVPLYWMVTTAYLAGALLVPGADKEHSALFVITSYLFIPFRRADASLQPLVGQGWTLNYEMQFYAIFAAAVWLRRYAAIMAACWVVLILVIVGEWMHLPAERTLLLFWTSPILLEFVFGCMIGMAVLYGMRLPAVLGWAMIVLGAWLFMRSDISVPGQYVFGRAAAWGVPVAMIVAGAVWGGVRLPGVLSRPLEAVGDGSYVLYLVHPPVIHAVILAWRRSGVPIAFWPCMAVSCLVCALVAVALHRWLERPLTDWLRRRWLPEAHASAS